MDLPPSYQNAVDARPALSPRIGFETLEDEPPPDFQNLVTPVPGFVLTQAQTLRLFPTILLFTLFDPDADAVLIKSFSKGILGTDDKAVIGVMGKRTLAQRWEISAAYRRRYGKDFPPKLKSSVSRALLLRPVLYLAQDLHEALHHVETSGSSNADGSTSSHTDHRPIFRTVIEIMCSSTPDELMDIAKEYNIAYRTTLHQDIQSFTSGKLNKLLRMLLTDSRQSPEGDEKLQLDVQRLAQCDGSDEDKLYIVTLFASKNAEYLKRVIATYDSGHKSNSTGLSVQQLIQKHYSSSVNKQAVMALYSCLYDRPSYFADTLREAMTRRDSDGLLRVVIWRCELDLALVKEMYFKRHGKHLEDGIVKHTSGTTKHILLALSGSPK